MKALGCYIKKAYDEAHWWIIVLPFVIWGLLAAIDAGWHL